MRWAAPDGDDHAAFYSCGIQEIPEERGAGAPHALRRRRSALARAAGLRVGARIRIRRWSHDPHAPRRVQRRRAAHRLHHGDLRRLCEWRELTLTSNLVAREIVGLWLFNFDPALDPTQLTFAVVGTPGSVPNSIDTGIDAFMAAGGGRYDIRFDFPPPPGHDSDAFGAGETVVYDITYKGPNASLFGASSFDFLSDPAGGNGTYASAAHIMRIGAGGDGSGWIGGSTLPEPSTALLLGAGLVALGVRRRSTRAA